MQKQNVLLVIDVQPAFYDTGGKYKEVLEFIRNAKEENTYDNIIGTIFTNTNTTSFFKYVDWMECIGKVEEIEYDADETIVKNGYGLVDYSALSKSNKYTLIGCNTGACVLKVALDLFDRQYDFEILTSYCYSSDGEEEHLDGLKILNRLMPLALK